MNLEMMVEAREQLRQDGEYEIADKLKAILERHGVLIEDGKRVVYTTNGVEKFREEEAKERDGKKRFLSWLNGQYRKMGYPTVTYHDFWIKEEENWEKIRKRYELDRL
jgi:hypothetical protein